MMAKWSFVIQSYKGDDSWVEPTVKKIHKVLNSNDIPKADPACDYCAYQKAVNDNSK